MFKNRHYVLIGFFLLPFYITAQGPDSSAEPQMSREILSTPTPPDSEISPQMARQILSVKGQNSTPNVSPSEPQNPPASNTEKKSDPGPDSALPKDKNTVKKQQPQTPPQKQPSAPPVQQPAQKASLPAPQTTKKEDKKTTKKKDKNPPAPVMAPGYSPPVHSRPSYHPVPSQPIHPAPSYNQPPANIPSRTLVKPSSHQIRKHRFSFEGDFIPWLEDGRRDSLLLNLHVDYGYGFGNFEIGPFLSADIDMDFHSRLNFEFERLDWVAGGFVDVPLVFNSTKARYVPSIGVKLGFGRIPSRNKIELMPYLAMKFFLNPSTAILIDMEPSWIFVFNDPDLGNFRIKFDYGIVHYFL